MKTIAFIRKEIKIIQAISLIVTCTAICSNAVFLYKMNLLRAYVTTNKSLSAVGEDIDQQDIYAEVEASDIGHASELMMWALRSDSRYKYVELKPKPGFPNTMLVLRHTKERNNVIPASQPLQITTFGINGKMIVK